MKKFYNCKLKVVKEESSLYVYDNLQIRCPKDIVKMLNSKIDISSEPDEKVWIVCMDIRNNVKCFNELVSGGSNICHIDLKKILKVLVMSNTSKFILVHNHPSGDVNPSREDVKLTKRIKDNFALLDYTMLDHIIVGTDNTSYYSIMSDIL